MSARLTNIMNLTRYGYRVGTVDLMVNAIPDYCVLLSGPTHQKLANK